MMKRTLCLSLAVTALTSAVFASDFKADLSTIVEKASKDGVNVVSGKDGWLFFVPELRHLSVGPFWGEAAAKVSRASKPEWADPLPAILDFKAQLDKAGIGLVMVPVPAKVAVYSEMLIAGAENGEATRLDSADAEFIKLLGSSGVQVIDLLPEFLKAKREHPDKLLYTKEDTHWSPFGISIASAQIAKTLAKEPWVATATKNSYSVISTEKKLLGDLASMKKDGVPGPESVTLQSIKDAKGTEVAPWRQSPLVLLGDSHNLIYSAGDDMLATGSGLPENLALTLGFATDVVAVRGSGATPARVNLSRRGDNLAGKKCVIWCFTVREFTEGQGWRKVPVIRTGN